ncbi:MAG: PorT family protein [Bacteroidaceae bacterium]|nr:PorT family protein [Bacteroidaceae bacterium]
MRRGREIVLLVFLFVSTLANAQVGNLRSTLSIGANGGVSLSRMDIVPSLRQTFNMGKTFGATLRYTSEKYFFLICGAQLEANYVERGWKELIEDGTGDEYSRQVSYVEIPFLCHLGIGREFYGVQGFLNIGPQIGFLLSDKEIKSGNWTDLSGRPASSGYTYGKKFEKTFEYGIAGGLGIELKTRAGSFSLEGRYYYGLSDVFGNKKSDPFARSANSSIIAKLGWTIDLIR